MASFNYIPAELGPFPLPSNDTVELSRETRRIMQQGAERRATVIVEAAAAIAGGQTPTFQGFTRRTVEDAFSDAFDPAGYGFRFKLWLDMFQGLVAWYGGLLIWTDTSIIHQLLGKVTCDEGEGRRYELSITYSTHPVRLTAM